MHGSGWSQEPVCYKKGRERSSKQINHHWEQSAAPRNASSPDGWERESMESTNTGEGEQEQTRMQERPGGSSVDATYADLRLKNHRQRGYKKSGRNTCLKSSVWVFLWRLLVCQHEEMHYFVTHSEARKGLIVHLPSNTALDILELARQQVFNLKKKTNQPNPTKKNQPKKPKQTKKTQPPKEP